MPNHLHLLLETPQPNLGAGMQRLQGSYAQSFNRRHHRTGHLFQGRYGSAYITSDEHLWTVAGYVALNPVSAGLCEAPEEWPWSSHGSMLDARRRPGWLDGPRLLSYFEGLGGDPRRHYAAITAAPGRSGEDPPVAATVSRR
jgi:putative transposase